MIPPWVLPKRGLILHWARLGLVLLPTWVISTAVAGESRTGAALSDDSRADQRRAGDDRAGRRPGAPAGRRDGALRRRLGPRPDGRVAVRRRSRRAWPTVSPTGVVTPGAEGQGRLVVEAGGRIDRGDRPRRAGRLGPARQLSARRRRAAVEGRLQHGGLPRQPQRQGGFRLSLRGDDPAFDLASLTRDTLGRRIDRDRSRGRA